MASSGAFGAVLRASCFWVRPAVGDERGGDEVGCASVTRRNVNRPLAQSWSAERAGWFTERTKLAILDQSIPPHRTFLEWLLYRAPVGRYKSCGVFDVGSCSVRTDVNGRNHFGVVT